MFELFVCAQLARGMAPAWLVDEVSRDCERRFEQLRKALAPYVVVRDELALVREPNAITPKLFAELFDLYLNRFVHDDHDVAELRSRLHDEARGDTTEFFDYEMLTLAVALGWIEGLQLVDDSAVQELVSSPSR